MAFTDPRIEQKMSSKGWDTLRPAFEKVHHALLSTSPNSAAELTTIYIKYKYANDPSSEVFAVVWVKSIKQLIVGLAMPPHDMPEQLSGAPPRCTYPPLNGFLTVNQGDKVPAAFEEWARMAFDYRKSIVDG